MVVKARKNQGNWWGSHYNHINFSSPDRMTSRKRVRCRTRAPSDGWHGLHVCHTWGGRVEIQRGMRRGRMGLAGKLQGGPF